VQGFIVVEISCLAAQPMLRLVTEIDLTASTRRTRLWAIGGSPFRSTEQSVRRMNAEFAAGFLVLGGPLIRVAPPTKWRGCKAMSTSAIRGEPK
jgi:hypothetical protein